MRDDARLAAPNTYGSFWDAANRGNPARGRPAHGGHCERGVATTAAWAQRIGALQCTQLGNGVNPNGENLIAGPAANDFHQRQVLAVLRKTGLHECVRGRVRKAQSRRPGIVKHASCPLPNGSARPRVGNP